MALKTPQNSVPEFAELGEKGQARWLNLQLKLVADVGIIGVPNAGSLCVCHVMLCYMHVCMRCKYVLMCMHVCTQMLMWMHVCTHVCTRALRRSFHSRITHTNTTHANASPTDSLTHFGVPLSCTLTTRHLNVQESQL